MFIPAVDSTMTISLPGEVVRATVKKVVDRDTCLLELAGTPLMHGKTHMHKKGEIVAVERTAGLRGDEWRVIDEYALRLKAEAAEDAANARAAENKAIHAAEKRKAAARAAAKAPITRKKAAAK